MRIAILSDIHGNMEAFKEVVADLKQADIDGLISLGDNIGYGPESHLVMAQIMKHRIPSIMGNHELAVTDRAFLELFNDRARQSMLKTISQLSNKCIEYICLLEPFMVSQGCRFVHGFPPASITDYQHQISSERLRRTFREMKEKICFTGHTHFLEMIENDGRTLSRTPLHQGLIRLDQNYKYIINAGSVGQPRDGNNNAKYLIWDDTAYMVEVRYVPYDVQAVIKKILQAGFPRANAQRLL
jgi:predicted phosphodiesterase